MAGPDPEPVDAFIVMSGLIKDGLKSAILECGWIADGGGTASDADRAMANARKGEYERALKRVFENVMDYLSNGVNVQPPTDTDLKKSAALAQTLENMESTNVKVTTVVNSATALLKLYKDATGAAV